MEESPLREVYRRRQSAHKWLLVTCFGYLGYKNARFGRIEAHEVVTAYGRECLLQAKEIAESRGFRVLYANVDSVWIQKELTTKNRPNSPSQKEYNALIDEITRTTQIPIALEGIYRWVAFLASSQDPKMSVANRYVAVLNDGEIKMRGIATRRRDTAPFIVDAQIEMLKILASANSCQELPSLVEPVIQVACAYADALRSGQVPYQDLVITKRLSLDPRAFVKDSLLSIAAKELLESGIELSPGESIQYITLAPHASAGVTEEHADAKCDRARPFVHYRGQEPYDAEKYIELLLRAVEVVLSPLGIKDVQIKEWVKQGTGEAERAKLYLPKKVEYWGPLFEFAERAKVTTR